MAGRSKKLRTTDQFPAVTTLQMQAAKRIATVVRAWDYMLQSTAHPVVWLTTLQSYIA
ncbi:MAG: hypothetical protein K0R08_1412 [Solimicrobium sp.]|jgi:hypothetical protein|nr:hypothetical protein [Solimicrobium sp.]